MQSTELTTYDYLPIVDLESTCCDKNTIQKGEHEIIEIGAVMVSTDTLKIIDEFTTFVKPQVHTKLTAFCTELTSITQSDVESAPVFPGALKRLSHWLSTYDNYLFCSWGNYDRNHMQSDSERHCVVNPLQASHLNLKKRFAQSVGVTAMGMQRALDLVGIKLEGVHHRGIDDARNIARLLPYIFGLTKLSYDH